MQGLVGKLNSNFIIAAFIPSLWFVVAAQIIFNPLDPAGPNSWFAPPKNFLDGDGLVTLLLTFLVGFTLMGLNNFIYKLLEGYFLLEKIPLLHKRQFRKALKRQLEFEWRDRLADRILSQNAREPSSKHVRQILQLRQESRNLKAQYQQDYPVQIRGVLPTRFGNILKAFELYANENFGIDAVVMWPRLIHVMDPEYYKKVDQSNNGLAFIVNCMVLSLALSVLCLLASGSQFLIWSLTLRTQLTYWQRGWLYFGGSVLLVGLAFFFYYASLPAAREYGNMVRSAFDLFRFDLLEQLRLPLPANDAQEYKLWTSWSQFVALGQFERKRRKPFEYTNIGSQVRKEPQVASKEIGAEKSTGNLDTEAGASSSLGEGR